MTADTAKNPKPLAGWRVLVPRGGKWGDGVAATVRGFGGIPVIAPLINFASTEPGIGFSAAFTGFSTAVTSGTFTPYFSASFCVAGNSGQMYGIIVLQQASTHLLASTRSSPRPRA